MEPMKRRAVRRRSPKRQAVIVERPVIASVSLDRTPICPTDESFREFIRRLPCVVCCRPTLGGDPCHLHTSRVSGDWLEVDGELVGNIFPACRLHHGAQHSEGIYTFPSARGLDLDATVLLIGKAYRLGWSADGLGAAALRVRGYVGVDVSAVLDGELPC
jgi:hypothetical protein